MKVTTDSCLFGAWVAEEAGAGKPACRTGRSEAGRQESKIKNQNPKIVTVLDIGTGTGLLSLMLAQKNNADITAVEIDNNAFLQASENIGVSPWKEHIKMVQGDIKNFLPLTPYDIIISNPPFYEREWLSPDAKRNMAHHSSNLLLEDLLGIIAILLKPGGRFYLLLPYKRYAAILELLDRQKIFITQQVLVRQTEEHDFFRFMIEGCFENTPGSTIKELAIKNKNSEYTTEFTALLKDYYLYM